MELQAALQTGMLPFVLSAPYLAGSTPALVSPPAKQYRNFFPNAQSKPRTKSRSGRISEAIDSTEARNGDSVSRRRFQKGSVYLNKSKTMWVGEYSEYVLDAHGVEKRTRKQVVLSPVKRSDGTTTVGKREAQRLLQPKLDKVNSSIASPARERKSITFEAFAEIWKRDYLSQSKPSTQSACTSHVKKLTTQFGDKEMRSIGAGDIQRMITERMKQKDDPWKPKTVRNVWGTISQIWQAALAQGYVDSVLPKPKLPRIPKTKPRCFRLQEVARMIAASEGEERLFYWLAAETGLRSGEIAGLRLTDIDGESLKINQSVWHGKEQEPKTDNAKRMLALSPQLVSLLWEQIARQKRKEQAERDKTIKHQFLFTSQNGTPWDMDVKRSRKLHSLLKSLEIPTTGFHAFRRFNISLQDALGVPRLTIKERSGHAFIGDFTMDVYGAKPEWDSNLKAARLLGAEIEKAVRQVVPEQESTPETVFEEILAA
jgi:integrase